MTGDNAVMTLYELNSMVSQLVKTAFCDTYRVKAELSEVRVSAKGHCFIELVQKGERGNVPIAKARGVIMADVYALLKLDFEETTGQVFRSGLEVLLEVRPTFSEVYGYSLIVTDIDASYTLGDMARRRKEILDRLEKEGVADLQKELELPLLLQRIAIISSPTAAGYGDFCHQIDENEQGFRFICKLFPALMQGEETESSIIRALDRIAEEQEQWDAVVIIRGGGAVSDLCGFETYNLANHCAQFPLPIIIGIGHQRDLTVLDLVAHMHLKTPTAVGNFLISHMMTTATMLDNAEQRLRKASADRVNVARQRLESTATRVEWFFKNYRTNGERYLDDLFKRICQSVLGSISMEKLQTEHYDKTIGTGVKNCLYVQQQRLTLLEQKMELYDPQHILRMGYSITLKNGRAVRDVSEIHPGDKLLTRLEKGEIESVVK